MLRVFLQQTLRDRVILPVWILGIVGLIASVSAAVVTEFGDVEARTQILAIALATPALLALRGIPNGDSVGSAMHFQSFAFLAVAIGLMNVFLATRHGRADEERGRRELLAATPIRRLTPAIATMLLAILANAVFGLLAVPAYRIAGVDFEGAALSATALALTGLVFFGVGALAGELTATARAANSIGVIAVLVSYALRGAGDALGTPDVAHLTLEPAWPSALSPIGWGQQTLAFTANRWWPVAALALVAVLLSAAALVTHSRREVGESLLPERAGRASAAAGFRSPIALFWRLHYPTLIAWGFGSALLGLALGSLVTAMGNAAIDSPELEAIIQSLGHTGQASLAEALVPAVLGLVGGLAGAAGVQAVLRLRDDETEGRAESMLAAPVSRVAWLLSAVAIGVASVVIVLAATGGAALAGFALLGNPDVGWRAFAQSLAEGPAALTFVAVAAAALALVPRAAAAIAWAFFALSIGWGLFGPLFDAPEWTDHLSPSSTVPVIPSDDWGMTIVLGAVVAALVALAAFGIRRRDLAT